MMIEPLEQKLEVIRELCKRHRGRTLHLFGSATTPDFDPATSDFDFLVEFLPDAPRTGLSGAYFALREDLAALMGRPVDLVETTALTNPYVAASIERTKVPIYATA